MAITRAVDKSRAKDFRTSRTAIHSVILADTEILRRPMRTAIDSSAM
jgi:hypothetical protein